MFSFRLRISHWDYLISALLGLVMVLAFEPFAIRPVIWLSPAIFFWLNLKQMRASQRVLLAWCYGLGLFAGGTHWIYVSIHFFGGANSLVASIMVLLFIMLVAVTMMLFGWLASFFPDQHRTVKLLVVFPALWALTEWFRGWFLTGFPWLQVGHTQVDSWLGHYAALWGSLGVGWVVMLGSGALVLLVIGNLRERWLAVSLLLVFTIGGLVLSQKQWTQPVDEPIQVALIQANIAQQDKWVPQLRNAHIQKHMDLMADYVDKADLIIWPETAIPDTFQRSMNDVILPLQKYREGRGVDFLLGGFHYEPDTRHTYNAMMAISDELAISGKRHLVPFSEYIPLLDYVRWLEHFVRLPYDNVTAWREPINLTLAGQPMRMSICYEDVYGEEMIEGLPEATLLVNLSNDGWFTDSIQPQQHAEIARMRTLETGRFMLRATNNGVSAIINHRGEVIASAPQYEATVIYGEAQPMQGQTPYIRWGNWGLIPFLILLLLGFWWYGRGKFY